MLITRNSSGNLHREGLPAVVTRSVKQYFWEGKLHNSRGPAVETVYGGRSYYWKGIYIPKKLWREANDMTLKEILKISNVELRRCILEKVGLEKFNKEAEVLDKDHDAKLMKIEIPNDEPVVFMRLLNSTQEENGVRKEYHIRVPPDTNSVRAGKTWINDIPEGSDWQYLAET